MTITKDDKETEPEIVVSSAPPDPSMITAVGVEEMAKPDGVAGSGGGGKGNEPPIPPGHSRFYCSKCRSVSVECVQRLLLPAAVER